MKGLFEKQQKRDWSLTIINKFKSNVKQLTFPIRIGVLDVQRRGGVAVHTTDKPVPVGEVVNASVDWERRFDHMQQHTGQHLLSAIAEQEPYKLNTVSWNLGRFYVL